MIYFLLAGVAGLLALNANKAIETVEEHMDFWNQFDVLFKKYGITYGVDWTWLKAIALNESDLGREKSVALGLVNPTDVNGSKSYDGKSWGLMQVTLTTAKGLDPSATEIKLNDADYSVKLSAKYIAQLKGMYSPLNVKFMEYVIKSYNQGPGNTKKEISGTGGGYANEYWARFQRNLKRVEDSL